MKQALIGLTIVSLALCGSALARQQVIANGSFEEADPNLVPLNWNQFGGAAQDPDFAWHGAFSTLASVRQNAYVGLYQDATSVGANVRVLVRAKAYVPAVAPLTGNIVGGVKLEFYPPEGLEVPPPAENLGFDNTQPTNTWVPITLTTVVPPQIDSAKIVVINFENPADPNVPLTNGPLYADFVSAVVSSAPGVNKLTNFSFETGTSSAQGLTGWTEFADPLSGARKNRFEITAYDASYVAKFTGRTAGLAQSITVTPGDTLTVTAYFYSRADQPYADPLAKAGVKIEWGAGSIPTPHIDVAPNANPISGTTNIVHSGSPTDQWVPVTIDYTIPAGRAAKLRATLISAFGPGDTDVYFDGAEMVLANVFNGSDVNEDGAEDLIDIATLQQVYGPGLPLQFLGLVYDHNENEQVEFSDASYTLVRMTGPAQP